MPKSESSLPYSVDRLQISRYDDEPFGDEYQDFQRLLDAAYEWDVRGEFEVVFDLLARGADLPQTAYQQVRSEYLIAKCCKQLDDRDLTSTRYPKPDLRAVAIERLTSAAKIAGQIPDAALVAHIKSLESAYCFTSKPYSRRLSRASLAAQAALDAWLDLEGRTLIDELYFEFTLADAVGVCAQAVGDYHAAVGGMETAAIVILKLRDRVDPSAQKYLYFQFLLDWDWASLNQARGKLKYALMRAFAARKLALSGSDKRNFGRVNTLIAEIALDCIDNNVTWDQYSEPRLISVAESAARKALVAARAAKDDSGYVLALLAQARRLRHSPDWRKSEDMLKQADKRAKPFLELDPILQARIELAWGDEYAFLYAKRKSGKRAEKARGYYLSAEERLSDMEALGLRDIAQRRNLQLYRLVIAPKPRGSRKKRPFDPPSPNKIILC